MISRAFAAALEDSNILVLRGALELLSVNFPLRLRIFQADDISFLMRYVLGAFLKKDMSLNRRLFAWTWGTESSSDHFTEFARPAMVNAFKELLLRTPSDLPTATRPFRILVCLLDKPEIATPLLEDLMPVILQSLRTRSLQYRGLPGTSMNEDVGLFSRLVWLSPADRVYFNSFYWQRTCSSEWWTQRSCGRQ